MEDELKGGKKKLALLYNRIFWGVAVSFLAALLYTACYRIFQNDAVEEMSKFKDNPLEDQQVMDWLMKENYVLYRDLCRKQSPEDLSYFDLYVTPAEGCEWVLDEASYNEYQYGGADAVPEREEVPEEGSEESDVPIQALPVDCGRVYSYLRYLQEEYFSVLEEQFSALNYTFDYYCEDLKTNEFVSNSDRDSIKEQGNYLELAFVYDEYGNCTVEKAVFGEPEPSLMRKLANSAARTVRLESDPGYIGYSERASVGLEEYFTLGRPANCRIVYSISEAEWDKYEQGEKLMRLMDGNYSVDNSYNMYMNSGRIPAGLFLLGGLAAVIAFFWPVSSETEAGRRKFVSRAMGMSLEPVLGLGYFGVILGVSICTALTIATLTGSLEQTLRQVFPAIAQKAVIQMAVYALNLLLQTAFFLFLWYIGAYLSQMRRTGVRKFVRERSLIYRFFPFMKSKVQGFYYTFSHFDVTKNAHKLIIRLVLINAVILFIIGSLWVGGFAITVVYSILLYFVLRKYVSDLQKKYGLLLRATNEIAEGNLNVQIKEDLGVFEPFKPQVYRIQEGFKRAVEEEVKSQRMKAELITNVSHDLKTPLTAIITYVSLLKEENVTEEQRREYLDTLERKSLRLKALIEDLFEISKATSQNMTLNIMDVDVMNLVKQVAFEMGDKLSERKLDLRMALSDEKVILPLDSQRTYRVYENLFGNIAKYAMPGTRVYVNGFCVDDKVMITLKNITAEEIAVKPEELTDRFVRGDAARNTEGSGLGLAIAKSFIELQGGELELDVDGDLFKVTTVWTIAADEAR